MGADIHGVVQSRYGSTEEWRNDLSLEINRNYMLFAALADVRNYRGITPIDRPRGLPEDSGIGPEGNVLVGWQGVEDWIGDHSYTWFTLDELLQWDGWSQKVDSELTEGGETLRDYCQEFLHWLEYANRHVWGNQKRLIVGFDS